MRHVRIEALAREYASPRTLKRFFKLYGRMMSWTFEDLARARRRYPSIIDAIANACSYPAPYAPSAPEMDWMGLHILTRRIP
jgi:hypothetical protein